MLTALNPVTTCGIVTHQVDGILVSLMACAVAAGVSFLRRPRWQSALVLFLSAALCVNTKFTGLVYLCFFVLTGGLYCLWRRRDLLVRYGVLVGIALIVGIVVFGFNPYVTNTIHRGHPFYPMQGSAEFPSLADRGRDPIELYETPHNMMGRTRLLRLAYGVFGKPGTAPYGAKDATFMWPFAVTWRDFALYYFHDVRIGGFGPLFGGALLLALALAAVGCARRALPCGVVLLLGGATLASLLVSTHTWWARYGPHLWWLPIIPVAAALRVDGWPLLRRAAAVIALLLLTNTLLVSAVHMRWEWRSTQALRQQLADLRQAGPMTVDLAYFDVPVAERFRTAGVAFETIAEVPVSRPAAAHVDERVPRLPGVDPHLPRGRAPSRAAASPATLAVVSPAVEQRFLRKAWDDAGRSEACHTLCKEPQCEASSALFLRSGGGQPAHDLGSRGNPPAGLHFLVDDEGRRHHDPVLLNVLEVLHLLELRGDAGRRDRLLGLNVELLALRASCPQDLDLHLAPPLAHRDDRHLSRSSPARKGNRRPSRRRSRAR